ncbi:MAG: peptide chain release factor-like protein [Lentisphaeria bacterium]|nr:peptide chain release factor-like protein [Lentisphaeria bacterium]
MTAAERNAMLTAEDAVLLRDCEFIMQKGTGNGGQKINKTSSAVRLRHRPTGIAVVANEERSQAKNRHIALRKLRYGIALRVHADPPGADDFALLPSPSPENHARLILWTAALFDRLTASDFDLAHAATLCGVSASQLERAMRKYPHVWRAWSEAKRKNGGEARD